ncbi:hypothetical protein CGCA056_v001882 [Colletotrichum aenigma]|uniref:uncharacterized protein n=1 Tax=Colletotrichum aenigma TaxID=1215731 RepID=UPI001872C047|nr:uncharacterized protein CGCA056_v001882 [Colletotrichum aenigma]KAF5528182.1 hypothetical protein CGCA056_v001882 [Colletotrichum aenigma]
MSASHNHLSSTDSPADFDRDSAAAIIDCCCASASAGYHRPSRHHTPGDYINTCTTANSTARRSSGQHGGATSIIATAACRAATAGTHDCRHVYYIQRGSTAEHVG